jgi:hypothetical protein
VLVLAKRYPPHPPLPYGRGSVAGDLLVHEVGVAWGIIDAVRQETAARGLGRATKVGVRIGEMAGIDPESLAFCFEALVKGTEMEPLELVIEKGRADELVFAFLELEDNDTRTDGRESP